MAGEQAAHSQVCAAEFHHRLNFGTICPKHDKRRLTTAAVYTNVTDYTDKAYGVCLEWVYYTDGRARKVIDYIKEVLKETDCVEMWCVWLADYYEYEDRPFIHNKSISVADLTETNIKEMDCAEIWNKRDKHYPDRPSFYRLTIHR